MKKRNIWATATLALALLLVSAIPVQAQTPTPTATATTAAASGSLKYTVQLGDTWASISRKYGVSASRLLDINNLRTRPDLLFVGEQIVIPVSLGTTPSLISPFLYTVHSGDTVNSVVSLFFIDKTALLQANKLTSKSVLTPGSQILIPAGPHRYTVQKGDTIHTIAAMFSTTANNLLRFNPHLGNGGAIFPGNNVYVPIQYDVTFVAAALDGVGGGGESTISASTTSTSSVSLSSASGLPTVVADPAAVAAAANANVISTSEFITMPQNIVNLNQPLQIRWFRLNSVTRDPARDNGANVVVVLQFRGGNGSYTVRHFVNEGGGSFIRGLSIRGIYVNPGESELWNDIEIPVQTNCASTISDTIIFSSGGTTLNARYELRVECPSP